MRIPFNKNQEIDIKILVLSSPASEKNSVSLNQTGSDLKRVGPRDAFASRPLLEEKLTPIKQRSPQNKKDSIPALAFVQSRHDRIGKERNLTENLLKHLNVGSNDALNLVASIFDFHHFDKVLLANYIDDKSPPNLEALEIQIRNLADQLVDPRSHQ